MSWEGSVPKATIHQHFLEALRDELSVLEAVTEAARDEATSEQSRPENKYDTRALEASYLAAGQGERLATLRKLVAWMEGVVKAPQSRVGLGAVVHVELDGSERWMMLAPAGGPSLEIDGQAVAMVSNRSPFGRALVGAEVGDAREVAGPKGTYEVEILGVH